MAKIEYYRTEVKRITDEYNSRKLSYNEYVTKLDWIKERIEAEVRYIETQQTPTTKMEYYIAEAKRVQDKYDKKMINSYEYNKEYERIANRIKAEEYEAEIERVSMELNIGKLTYPQCKAEIKRIETEYKYKESVFSYLFCKNCYYDY
jgi:chromosome segregation ATPase